MSPLLSELQVLERQELTVDRRKWGLFGSRALTRRSPPNETCSIKRREKVSMCLNAKQFAPLTSLRF